jgi:hypothetical protein
MAEVIGELLGALVSVDRESQSVIIASDDYGSIRFHIDHPCIQGTTLERAARAALTAPTSKL